MQSVRCQSFCISPLFTLDTLRQGTHRTVMALTSLESHHSEDLSKPPPLLESVAGRKYHYPLCLSSPSLQYPAKSKSWRSQTNLKQKAVIRDLPKLSYCVRLCGLPDPGSRRKVSDVLIIRLSKSIEDFVLRQLKEKNCVLITLRSQIFFKFTKFQRFL